MLTIAKLRPFLTASTSAAALGLALFVFLPQAEFKPKLTNAPLPPVMAPAAAPNVQPMALDQESVQPVHDALARQKMAGGESQTFAQSEVQLSDEAMDATGYAAEPFPSLQARPEPSEVFSNAPENAVRVTTEDPVSTFSIDVDTASWSILRSSLNMGLLPDPDAVRIEEMLNYFPYDYAQPAIGSAPFHPSIAVMETPWNSATRLVRIALQGRSPGQTARPPLNLVFLVDTSGSMNDPAKLPLLKQSLALLLGQLRPDDQIALVAYAGSAGEILPPTRAEDRSTILTALDRLTSGGSTAGVAGLELAYDIAARMTEDGEVSRVLLATDGDFNVGISDPDGLETFIADKRKSGTYLSVLGFGRGNLDDKTMQTLAQAGNGTASYIDTLHEAQKVLVDQLQGALFPIADDVKIQVEWNPQAVAEYRLIGYETRALRREDFNNDKVDAGEIGAGHQVTALYEITAPDSLALLNDPLRYGAETQSIAPITNAPELGFLKLRYKEPGGTESHLIEAPITTSQSAADSDAKFAAAIAGFGQLLRGGTYLGEWGWDDAIALASQNLGQDRFGYRVEAVKLMRLAKSISE